MPILIVNCTLASFCMPYQRAKNRVYCNYQCRRHIARELCAFVIEQIERRLVCNFGVSIVTRSSLLQVAFT